MYALNRAYLTGIINEQQGQQYRQMFVAEFEKQTSKRDLMRELYLNHKRRTMEITSILNSGIGQGCQHCEKALRVFDGRDTVHKEEKDNGNDDSTGNRRTETSESGS